jgi:hypothetical protein
MSLRRLKHRRLVATLVIAAVFFWAPSVVPVRAIPGPLPCGVPLVWAPSDSALAIPAIVPCPPPASGLGIGGAISVGIIGAAALLCLYDIWLKISGLKNWDGTPKTPPIHHHP